MSRFAALLASCTNLGHLDSPTSDFRKEVGSTGPSCNRLFDSMRSFAGVEASSKCNDILVADCASPYRQRNPFTQECRESLQPHPTTTTLGNISW